MSPLISIVLFILMALVIMPIVFLHIAIKMRLTPLNAVCLAILTSTAFSSGCWTFINNPESQKQSLKIFKEEFYKQLAVAEKQMNEQQINNNVDYSEAIQTLKENFDEILDKVVVLVPSTLIFLWHLVSLGFIYFFLSMLGEKIGYKVEPFPAFKDWVFDWNLVWLYIFGWAMYFFVGSIKNMPGAKLLQVLGANCFIISSILYMIIGFSLLFFMCDKYKIGTINRVGLSLIALFFSQFMVWLGLIDVWAEFRLRKATPQISDNSDDDFFDY